MSNCPNCGSETTYQTDDGIFCSECATRLFNQASFYQNSGSYDDILNRMTRRVQESKVDSQILEILQQVFEKEFRKEGRIILSRPERKRLFQQVSKTILAKVLGKMDDTE